MANSLAVELLTDAFRHLMEDHTPAEVDAVDHVAQALRGLGVDPDAIETNADLDMDLPAVFDGARGSALLGLSLNEEA